MCTALVLWVLAFAVYYLRELPVLLSPLQSTHHSASVATSNRYSTPARTRRQQQQQPHSHRQRQPQPRRPACCVTGLSCCGSGRCASRSLSTVGRVLLGLALVAYPAVCTAAIRLLHCNSATFGSLAALEALDWGERGAAPFAAQFPPRSTQNAQPPSTIVVLSVLKSNPYFVCWAGR
jgi:hypothetical protein